MDNQGEEDVQAAERQDLQPEMPEPWIGELADDQKVEDQRLGVQQIGDQAAPRGPAGGPLPRLPWNRR